jgi:D-alanine-D-alanine ligase-like ATP-grasp enzyme
MLSQSADQLDVRRNRYDDPESVAILKLLDRRLLSSLLIAREAESDGAAIAWFGSDTFLASLNSQEMLFKANRCTESVPAARAVRDKALVKSLLERASVGTPKGGVAGSLEAALEVYNAIEGAAVVKPARGDRGTGVTVGVTDETQLVVAYRRASAMGRVVVEEFVPGVEFRCLATIDECIGVVRRDAPNVVGDSHRTIEELIVSKNQDRKRNPSLQARPIVIDDHLVSFLAKSGLTLRSIPTAGVKVYVKGPANLTTGGDSIDYADTVPEVVKLTAVDAVRAIPGLRWGGVDVILADPDVTDAATGPRTCVLEINVNAGISGFHYPVYGRPRNVARLLWQTRLGVAASRPAIKYRVPVARTARPRPVGRTSPIQPNGEATQSGKIDLSAMLAARVSSVGADVERLGPQLLHISHASARHLMYGWSGTGDLTVVAQVLKRRAIQQRLLRRADVRVVPGRVARSIDDALAFMAGTIDPVVLLPAKGGPDRTVLDTVAPDDEAGMRAAWQRAGRGPVLLQAPPLGTRLRIFATRDAATTVLCDHETSLMSLPGARDVARAERLAVRAIGAVPELRWAAVDVIVPQRKARSAAITRAVVEGMTTEPTILATDCVIAGGLDAFFEAILPPELTHQGSISRMGSERRRLWRRGAP